LIVEINIFNEIKIIIIIILLVWLSTVSNNSLRAVMKRLTWHSRRICTLYSS